MMSLLRSFSLSDQPIRCSFLACVVAAAGALYNEARGQDAGASAPATGENVLQNLNYEPATDDQDTLYGEAPEDNSLVFLRRVSPLLKPGDYQADVGLAYTLYHADLPFLVDQTPDPDSVHDARIVARSVTVPFAVRYGLSKDLQLFMNAPLSWNNTEVAYAGTDTSENIMGIGGVTLGATCLLNNPSVNETSIIGSAGLTIPTGKASLITNPLDPGTQLGGSHFAFAGDLTFIDTIDPVILFYGVGVVRRLSREFHDRTFNVQPGIEFRYRFGVGFAVNDRLTLSSALFGSHLRDSTINDQRLVGSMREPVNLRIAATIAGNDRIQEPFVEFGLTDDATNVSMGWVWTF